MQSNIQLPPELRSLTLDELTVEFRCKREAASHQPSAERDRGWRAIFAAASWVIDLLIEGFAGCGASMQPGFFQPPGMDHVHPFGPGQGSRQTHAIDQPYRGNRWCADAWLGRGDCHAWPNQIVPRIHQDRAVASASVEAATVAKPKPRQTIVSRWITLITSPLVRVLNKYRPGPGTTLTSMELDALDDRTLRDIGLSRDQLDLLDRQSGGVR